MLANSYKHMKYVIDELGFEFSQNFLVSLLVDTHDHGRYKMANLLVVKLSSMNPLYKPLVGKIQNIETSELKRILK